MKENPKYEKGSQGMHILADSVLYRFIREVHEKAKSEEVSTDIFEVLRHLGTRSPYRGGKRLLQLLEDAITTAESNGDEFSENALSDALGYATGKNLEEDLNEKYDLNPYDDSGNFSQDQIQQLARWSPGFLLKEEIFQFLDANPNATTEEVRSHVAEITSQSLRFVRARRAGHYGAFRIRTQIIASLHDIFADRIEVMVPPASVTNSAANALMQIPDYESILRAVEIARRLEQLYKLELMVDNPNTKEASFQRQIESMHWLFGGSFARLASRRLLAEGTQVDIPLIRADGVLHVVELKTANIEIVKQYRSHVVPTANVNDAVSQVENYLRTLEENRGRIFDTFGFDTRRASGTVVIGHHQYQEGFDERAINEALRNRTYLGRIDVITYKELIDNARRTLEIETRSPSIEI